MLPVELSRSLHMGLDAVEAMPYDRALLTDLRLAARAHRRVTAGLFPDI